MKNLSIYDREFLIECLGKGTPLPDDFKEKLFPTTHKEYELRYAGKMRKEDLLADQDGTFAVPLQVEKIYNGEREKYKDGWRNMIVFGDNLQFLKTCFANKDELIRNKVKGKVKLIYIDPPFATESEFKNSQGQKSYTDKVKGAEFVEFLRRRLIVARELLSEDGSIFVHLDQKMCHHIRLVMDEIFGIGKFQNQVIWQGTSAHNDAKKKFGNIHQVIYWYYKQNQPSYNYNEVREGISQANLREYSKLEMSNGKILPLKGNENLVGNGNRIFRTVDATWKGKNNQFVWRGCKPNSKREWRFSSPKEMDIALKKGELFLTDPKVGAIRCMKKYLDENEGQILQDIWINSGRMSGGKGTYPTEKPEILIERILRAASKEGEIVMDFFGGGGTTGAVAEKLNRKWILCDIGKYSIYTIQKRMLSIQDSPNLDEPTKKYNKQAKSFASVNTGICDLQKMQELNQDKYIDFVLQLFEVTPMPKTIKGIKLHGERKDGYSVLVWDYWNHKESSVDIFFLEQLHQNIGKRISKRLYIIAPANAVQFISDFHEIDDVRYYFLKIPYQIIRELHPKSFAKFRQPSSKNKINDLDNAIGFHFMLQPEVQSEFKNGKLIIKKFISNFREEETNKQLPNFESLSMVIIDEKFNGKDFMMSQCIFNEDIESKNGTMQIQLGNTGKQICVIYIDLYGNEFKETIKVK